MSPLLAPLFAQVVTLGIGDRTEARYVKYEDQSFEGSTSPHVELGVDSRHAEFSAEYGPTLTLVPLEKKPRDLLVFHELGANAGYRWRTTRLSLSSSLGIGEVNFRLVALQGPRAPSGADAEPDTTDTPAQPDEPTPDPGEMPDPSQPEPNDPATGQLTIADRIVRYYTSTTTLTLGHEPAKDVRLGLQGGYTRAGGRDDESRSYYPEIRGWFVGGSAGYTYRLTARNAFLSQASLTQTWSSNGNKVATLNANETWQHTFQRRTNGALGAGLNITRFSQEDGLRGFSVFPTFQASLTHQLTLWTGTLSMTAYTFSAPALDPLRALVDPRLGFGGAIGYSRKRLSLDLDASTTLSLAPEDHDTGSIDSAQAQARIAYRIAELVEVDAGARYARQAVQGVAVLPSSYAAFVGLNAGYLFQLSGSRH